MKTAKAEKFFYAVRARLNSGASPEAAIEGAIRECGPLRTVRVSSAKARGKAGRYPYWGAVRYALTLTRSGRLSNRALERASSDRRSLRLAERDAESLAASEDRVECGVIGAVSAATVLSALGLT